MYSLEDGVEADDAAVEGLVQLGAIFSYAPLHVHKVDRVVTRLLKMCVGLVFCDKVLVHGVWQASSNLLVVLCYLRNRLTPAVLVDGSLVFREPDMVELFLTTIFCGCSAGRNSAEFWLPTAPGLS